MPWTIQFDHPAALLLIASAVVPWLLRYYGGRRGRLASLAVPLLQSLALILLAVALARPQWLSPAAAEKPVAIFIDASASQANLPHTLDIQWPGNLPREDFIFSETIARPGQQKDDAQTRINPVLSLIEANAANWSAAIIVTDGQFDDVPDPAANLPQLLLVPRSPDTADARLADFTARVDESGRVELAATVMATAEMEQTLQIRRTDDDHADDDAPLLHRRLRLLPGQPSTLRATDSIAAGLPAIYIAQLLDDDLLPQNNRLQAMALPPQLPLLWVAPEGAFSPQSEGHPIIASHQLADNPAALLGFAAIAVHDPDGRTFSPAQRAALAEYVRLGGGLVLIGAGPHDQPADRDDPLNRVLPLQVRLFERSRLDVTLLLDASGSMGERLPPPPAAPGQPQPPAGDVKFVVARHAALFMARGQLLSTDNLRVITFSAIATPRFDGPASPENINELDSILAGVNTVGGTRVTPALEMALAAPDLPEISRIVIVLSDLKTESFNPAAWARRFADRGITLAVVAQDQEDASAPLAQLADLLNAPLVYREDLAGLADVFSQFLRNARGDALRRRRTELAIAAPLFDTGIDSLPLADAWFTAAAVPDAEVLAVSEQDDPLLARRQIAAGRTVMLALPLDGALNVAWQTAEPTADLLKAALRWTAAPAGDPRFTAEIRPGPPDLLVVHAADQNRPMNLLDLYAEIIQADKPPRRIQMQQTAPGQYHAQLTDPTPDPAVINVRQSEDGLIVLRTSLAGRYAREYAQPGPNLSALNSLADQSGARLVSTEELLDLLPAIRAASFRPLWLPALLAALSLMLIAWIMGRLSTRG